MLLLNKADRLDDDGAPALLRRTKRADGAILLSAHDPADVAALRQTIVAFFEASMVEEELLVPYARQALLGEVYESARVVGERRTTRPATRLRVRGLPAAIARLQRLFTD